MLLDEVEGEGGQALVMLLLAVDVVHAEHQVAAGQSVQAGPGGGGDAGQVAHLKYTHSEHVI